ncbi:MAG: hypothetical protein Tsb0020_27970 [Haliangiales bacterium]
MSIAFSASGIFGSASNTSSPAPPSAPLSSAATSAARRERLEALLRWLHRHLPAAQAALDELASRGHPNLAQLRRAYQDLPEGESPKGTSEI